MCARLGGANLQQVSSLVKRDQLLEQLLENGINTISANLTWPIPQRKISSRGAQMLLNGEETAQNYAVEQVKSLKGAGTTVTKANVGYALHCHGLKSICALKDPC